ncbi:uncharacterized protein LOC110436222 [Sorghum bicolor]|uniref:uncharacterized protein LOC110436222 n=1 Tax=Sorghum bicolor TaxID=4558 RepID=UPI000B423DDD|nr:uncharacterized protein LOC110436222 [Sorghum bicolor]|eukprot:XP_021318358.1 uncharacterized protein LOC110436222 [Sorghum bicolor]
MPMMLKVFHFTGTKRQCHVYQTGYVEHSIKRRKNLFFCQPEHLLLLQVFKVFTWKETVSISVAKIHGHKQQGYTAWTNHSARTTIGSRTSNLHRFWHVKPASNHAYSVAKCVRRWF